MVGDVQRLFSTFPNGWPGFGLLLLRASVAFALIIAGFDHQPGLPGWIQGALNLLSLMMVVGYLTPIWAAAGLVVHTLICLKFGGESLVITVSVSLDLVALCFLGPGAYSVDACRFGRRVVVLPPR